MELPDQVREPASLTGPKALVRRLVEEGVNQGRLAVVDQLLASNVPNRLPDADGRERMKTLLERYLIAVPDAHWTITEQIAEEEQVVTCFVASGTQHGPLFGVPATGRQMAVRGMLLSRCRDGKIVSQRLELDLLGLLQQLGVMPELTLAEEVIVARLLQQSRAATEEE